MPSTDPSNLTYKRISACAISPHRRYLYCSKITVLPSHANAMTFANPRQFSRQAGMRQRQKSEHLHTHNNYNGDRTDSEVLMTTQ